MGPAADRAARIGCGSGRSVCGGSSGGSAGGNGGSSGGGGGGGGSEWNTTAMPRRLLLRILLCGLIHLLQTHCGSAELQAAGRPPNYSFSWGSIDGAGNGYGQEESRQGDTIRGSYKVTLPNGKVQVVDYSVDDRSGYVADVRYVDGPGGHVDAASVRRPGGYVDAAWPRPGADVLFGRGSAASFPVNSARFKSVPTQPPRYPLPEEPKGPERYRPYTPSAHFQSETSEESSSYRSKKPANEPFFLPKFPIQTSHFQLYSAEDNAHSPPESPDTTSHFLAEPERAPDHYNKPETPHFRQRPPAQRLFGNHHPPFPAKQPPYDDLFEHGEHQPSAPFERPQYDDRFRPSPNDVTQYRQSQASVPGRDPYFGNGDQATPADITRPTPVERPPLEPVRFTSAGVSDWPMFGEKFPFPQPHQRPYSATFLGDGNPTEPAGQQLGGPVLSQTSFPTIAPRPFEYPRQEQQQDAISTPYLTDYYLPPASQPIFRFKPSSDTPYDGETHNGHQPYHGGVMKHETVQPTEVGTGWGRRMSHSPQDEMDKDGEQVDEQQVQSTATSDEGPEATSNESPNETSTDAGGQHQESKQSDVIFETNSSISLDEARKGPEGFYPTLPPLTTKPRIIQSKSRHRMNSNGHSSPYHQTTTTSPADDGADTLSRWEPDKMNDRNSSLFGAVPHVVQQNSGRDYRAQTPMFHYLPTVPTVVLRGIRNGSNRRHTIGGVAEHLLRDNIYKATASETSEPSTADTDITDQPIRDDNNEPTNHSIAGMQSDTYSENTSGTALGQGRDDVAWDDSHDMTSVTVSYVTAASTLSERLASRFGITLTTPRTLFRQSVEEMETGEMPVTSTNATGGGVERSSTMSNPFELAKREGENNKSTGEPGHKHDTRRQKENVIPESEEDSGHSRIKDLRLKSSLTEPTSVLHNGPFETFRKPEYGAKKRIRTGKNVYFGKMNSNHGNITETSNTAALEDQGVTNVIKTANNTQHSRKENMPVSISSNIAAYTSRRRISARPVTLSHRPITTPSHPATRPVTTAALPDVTPLPNTTQVQPTGRPNHVIRATTFRPVFAEYMRQFSSASPSVNSTPPPPLPFSSTALLVQHPSSTAPPVVEQGGNEVAPPSAEQAGDDGTPKREEGVHETVVISRSPSSGWPRYEMTGSRHTPSPPALEPVSSSPGNESPTQIGVSIIASQIALQADDLITQNLQNDEERRSNLSSPSPHTTAPIQPPKAAQVSHTTTSTISTPQQSGTPELQDTSFLSRRTLHLPTERPRPRSLWSLFQRVMSREDHSPAGSRPNSPPEDPRLEHRPATAERPCCSHLQPMEPSRIVAPLSSIFGKRLGRLQDRPPGRLQDRRLEKNGSGGERLLDQERRRIVARRGRVLSQRQDLHRRDGRRGQDSGKSTGRGRWNMAKEGARTRDAEIMTKMNRARWRLDSPSVSRRQGFSDAQPSSRVDEGGSSATHVVSSSLSEWGLRRQFEPSTSPAPSDSSGTLQRASTTSEIRTEGSTSAQAASGGPSLRWPGATAGYVQSVHWVRAILPLFFGGESDDRAQSSAEQDC